MRAVAIIPARGGSKRLHRKNLCKVGGKTLVARAIGCALNAGIEAWVSTDDFETAQHAASLGATVRMRPENIACDYSPTEYAMQDWWAHLDESERGDAIVLLQPTSPLRTANDVAAAVIEMQCGGWDSVVSVHRCPIFRVSIGDDGQAHRERPWRVRPRSQDDSAYVENGAIYVTRRAAFEASGMRCSRRIGAYVMPWYASVDVDDSDDLKAADMLLPMVAA